MTTLPCSGPVALVVILLVGAGCLGVLVGDEPFEFSASKATIDDGVVSNAGYEHEETRELSLERTVEVAGESRDVEVTNWASLYTKAVEIEGVGEREVAMVAVLSTPEVDVLGQSFNPVGKMSDEELIEQVLANHGSVRDFESVDERPVDILGERAEVTKFAATLEIDGMDVDGYVHVGQVTHDGDVVVVAATYPKELSGEEERVFELFQAVEH